eukprot:IDg22928t1
MATEDVDLSKVPTAYRQMAQNLLRKHEHLWSGHLGKIRETEHYIDLVPGARPFRSHPYRAGPKQRELEDAEIQRMLEADVIRPSKSQWASPVLLIPKPDGSMRFCIDYRRLNELTVRDHYPIPRMEIAPESIDKTAFVSHSGFFEWTRMPFGLTNAPATFQRALDMILAGYKWRSCLVYLDDVIIFSKSVEEHITHLDEVLTALGRAGISLKLHKCAFFTDTVKYLGHRIRPGTLEIEMALTASLRQLRQPRTPTELRPLPRLLQDFTAEQLQAFKALIEKLTKPPILALPQTNLPYERHRKECLAVVYGVTTGRPYLYGQHFTVVTDHNSLRWLLEINDPASGRLMRWRLRLAEFDFDVIYKKGCLHTQPDALSRLPSASHTTEHEDLDIPCLLVNDRPRTSASRQHPTDITDTEDAFDDEIDVTTDEPPAYLSATPIEHTPISLQEIRAGQETDPFCQSIRQQLTKKGRAI